MKSLLIGLLLQMLFVCCFAQIDYDSIFVHRVTEEFLYNADNDYFYVINIRYGELKKDVVVQDNCFKYYLLRDKYRKCFAFTEENYPKIQQKIRRLLLSDDTLYISKMKYKAFELPEFVDIWEGDSLFHALKDNKEEFIKYYFNDDSTYRFPTEVIYRNEDVKAGKVLHYKTSKITAIIKQMNQWGIPVYGDRCKYKYGYYEKERQGPRMQYIETGDTLTRKGYVVW